MLQADEFKPPDQLIKFKLAPRDFPGNAISLYLTVSQLFPDSFFPWYGLKMFI